MSAFGGKPVLWPHRDRFDRTACLARSSSPLRSTTQSRLLRDFPKPRKLRRIGRVARQRLVSEIGHPKFGGDFCTFVSGREIPFPGNRDCRG
jgi:hypothetical protein